MGYLYRFSLSLQNNLRVRSVRLQSDIDNIQRRIAGVNVRLTTEMKV